METKHTNPLHFYTNNSEKSLKVEKMLVESGADFRKILISNIRSIHIPAIVTDTEKISDLRDIRRYLEKNSVTQKLSLDD